MKIEESIKITIETIKKYEKCEYLDKKDLKVSINTLVCLENFLSFMGERHFFTTKEIKEIKNSFLKFIEMRKV